MNFLDNNISKEEKIINAAIQCIEEHGLEGTTIRRIAEIADVNSAAISYYFRSKDNLIEKAMELSLIHAFDWNDYPDINEYSLKEYVVNIFTRLVEGARAFPGLTRAHFFDVYSKGDYNNIAVKSINQFLKEILKNIRQKYPDMDEDKLRTSLVQIASAAFLAPALTPRLFDSFFSIDFRSSDELKNYINQIVERLL